MFLLRFAAALLGLTLVPAVLADSATLSAAEAAKLVAAGKAVLVDVREAPEWRRTGVAAPAELLAKSDFDGSQAQWRPFLDKHRDKQILLYCASGARSGEVAAALAAKGHKAVNVGRLRDWTGAGLPLRKVD